MRPIAHKCLAVFIFAFLAGLLQSDLISAQDISSSSRIIINKIHYKHTAYKAEVNIDLIRDVKIRYNRLRNPDRIYVDIYESQIGPALKRQRHIVTGGPFITKIHTAQNNRERVRVVLYVDKDVKYTVNKIGGSLKIIVEVTAKDKKRRIQAAAKTVKIKRAKKREYSGIRQKRIVIDPGHGGKDPGAISKNGLKEKDIVLDISKRLARLIRKKLGCTVLLTREKDVLIPIRERTVIAKKNKADLFISVHINADNDPRARGVETYYLSPSTSREVLKIAARENMVTINDMEKNDLQFILADLASTFKINESIVLANHVQRYLIDGLKPEYKKVRNLGVKKGPFYVLVDAEMPSILVEAMFITNRKEEMKLRSSKYRQIIAQSIFNGISKYLEETVVAYKTDG